MADTAAWLVDRVVPAVPVRQWVSLGSGFARQVDALADSPNGGLAVAGNYSGVAGQIRHLAVSDGSAWSSAGRGLTNRVHALANMPNGDLLVCGRFTEAGGLPAARTASWNGSAWSPLGAGMMSETRGSVGSLSMHGRFQHSV